MISNKHKCFFIHIPKTGGSSVGCTMGIKNSVANILNHKDDHLTVVEAMKYFPKEWNEYFKWTIVRNPWDRFVSMYHFRKKKNYSEFIQNKELKFDKWLKIILIDRAYENQISQSSLIKIENKIAVDFVARYENLRRDFKYISKTIGFSGKLIHVNKTNHYHYSCYYDKYSVDLVYDICKEDISTFNYKFRDNKFFSFL